jgi:hypothetical protein
MDERTNPADKPNLRDAEPSSFTLAIDILPLLLKLYRAIRGEKENDDVSEV